MKTLAITALIGTLIALPFLLGKKRPVSIPLRTSDPQQDANSNIRYDVDDFLM